jgi:hypothetical protein
MGAHRFEVVAPLPVVAFGVGSEGFGLLCARVVVRSCLYLWIHDFGPLQQPQATTSWIYSGKLPG